MIGWTERHSLMAQCEGWDIFEADGSMQNRDGRSPYQIQRIDENPILSCDQEAWELVRRGRGEHHILALMLMQRHSPGEYELMWTAAAA